MKFNNLYDLIKYIEYGTKLHIGVTFLGNYGNEACTLPYSHNIHSSVVCWQFKKGERQSDICFRCKSRAIAKALSTKQAFGGLCINGIYEYTRPVTIDGEVVCIIYIGNILTEDGLIKIKKKAKGTDIAFDTLETNFNYTQCEEVGSLIESYIRILLDKYPAIDNISNNLLIQNIKSYIHENLEYDISIKTLATFFHYNEVYLGRLFKKETGVTIKEYINKSRVNIAKGFLRNQDSVISAAQKAGFNDVTYFNRIFKKYTSITPTEYKRQAITD